MKNKPELSLTNSQLISMYEKMFLIRAFEDKVFELFQKKLVPGTTHLSQGHEAVSVGVNFSLRKDDWITCTYRGHGNCIAKGVNPNSIMAEILGKVTGCCRGKGGSMHITDFKSGVLGSYAIVGAGIPVATGAAFSAKYRDTDQVAVSFFGDGAANIGAFHEGLNMASIMKLPVVFVCENNLYGEYTHISKSTAVKRIADRAASYSMPGESIDGNNVIEVYETARSAINRARAGQGPTLIECNTYRQKGHSRTDAGKYRPDEEVRAWLERDPLKIFSAYLISNGIATKKELDQIEDSQHVVVHQAYQFAMDSPYPNEGELLTNVYPAN